MDAFPAFFPLAGRTVVIAGTGDAAEAKARLFEGAPAHIVRLAGPEALETARYAGAVLAFVAGGEDGFAAGAAAAARAAGVPVNVVDHPELCDFISPAVIDRGEVVAAVGTSGAAPLLAALLRNDIEARVPQGAGRLAAVLRSVQDEVRAALPDIVARRAFLRSQLDGPAAQAAMAGQGDEARRLIRKALAEASDGRPVGRICVIERPGEADLLSLRAARRLAEADVLVAATGVDPGVVGLARRDARRLAPNEADLVALAAEGLTVVVLGPIPAAGRAALQAADIAVEVLASVG